MDSLISTNGQLLYEADTTSESYKEYVSQKKQNITDLVKKLQEKNKTQPEIRQIITDAWNSYNDQIIRPKLIKLTESNPSAEERAKFMQELQADDKLQFMKDMALYINAITYTPQINFKKLGIYAILLLLLLWIIYVLYVYYDMNKDKGTYIQNLYSSDL
jgi:hypothetical protein